MWYGKEEDKPKVSVSFIKYRPPVIVFPVIGIGFKSDLMLMEGSIDTKALYHDPEV
jgi:hypothetical protein